MKMSDTKQHSINIGSSVSGMLGVAFVVLKLVGVINWSWWWVTLPFWGGLAFAVGLLALLLFFYTCYLLVQKLAP